MDEYLLLKEGFINLAFFYDRYNMYLIIVGIYNETQHTWIKAFVEKHKPSVSDETVCEWLVGHHFRFQIILRNNPRVSALHPMKYLRLKKLYQKYGHFYE